jgi:hypothetical protein
MRHTPCAVRQKHSVSNSFFLKTGNIQFSSSMLRIPPCGDQQPLQSIIYLVQIISNFATTYAYIQRIVLRYLLRLNFERRSSTSPEWRAWKHCKIKDRCCRMRQSGTVEYTPIWVIWECTIPEGFPFRAPRPTSCRVLTQHSDFCCKECLFSAATPSLADQIER